MVDTKEKLQVLQHALGQDEFGQGGGFRNHFVTGPGARDYEVCTALVAEGLMDRRPGSALTGGADLFMVTDAGKKYCRASSPQPPNLTRSERRYREWLAADNGLSFREWIVSHSSHEEQCERQRG